MVIIENNKVKELETIIKKSDRQLVDILRKILNIQVDKIIIEKRLKLKDELFEDKYVKYVTQNIIKVLKDN